MEAIRSDGQSFDDQFRRYAWAGLIVLALLALFLRLDPLDPRTIAGKVLNVGIVGAVWVCVLWLVFVMKRYDRPRPLRHAAVFAVACLLSAEAAARLVPVYDSLAVNPGADHFWPDRFYPRNDFGLRDRKYDRDKAGKIRIIAVGDSYTEGAGVPKNLAYPAVLEKLLNSGNTGAHYEVMNFGNRGANTREEVELFQSVGRSLSPDFVIIQYCINDAEDHPTGPANPAQKSYSTSRKPWWLPVLQHVTFGSRFGLRSYAAYLVFNVSPELFPEPGIDYGKVVELEHSDDFHGWKNLVKGLDSLADMGKQDGFVPIMVVLPIINAPIAAFESVYRKVERQGRQSGLVTVDLTEALVKAAPPDELIVSKWDPHPNERAHRIIAEHLASLIRNYPAGPGRK